MCRETIESTPLHLEATQKRKQTRIQEKKLPSSKETSEEVDGLEIEILHQLVEGLVASCDFCCDGGLVTTQHSSISTSSPPS